MGYATLGYDAAQYFAHIVAFNVELDITHDIVLNIAPVSVRQPLDCKKDRKWSNKK